jgi:hypothetical protein
VDVEPWLHQETPSGVPPVGKRVCRGPDSSNEAKRNSSQRREENSTGRLRCFAAYHPPGVLLCAGGTGPASQATGTRASDNHHPPDSTKSRIKWFGIGSRRFSFRPNARLPSRAFASLGPRLFTGTFGRVRVFDPRRARSSLRSSRAGPTPLFAA